MTTPIRNVIRTAVAAIVGAAVTWITKQSAHISPSVEMVVFPVATSAYAGAVHYLEQRYPKLGWLLGTLPQPKVKRFPAGTTGVASKP
jgi:hypothetical protein